MRQAARSFVVFLMRAITRAVFIVAILSVCGSAAAQSPPNPNYQRQPLFASYADFKSQLLSIVGIADAAQRDTQLNAFWTTLKNAGQVPYAQGNQYAYLYRGTATSVAFAGDFNSWNPSAASARPRTSLAQTCGSAKARCQQLAAPTTRLS